jgi:beta-glucanase (GH16 family)
LIVGLACGYEGTLRLQMNYAPHERDGETVAYTSGVLISLPPSRLYAYVEARIKAAPRRIGVWTAFWISRNVSKVWTDIEVVKLTHRWAEPSIAYFNTHVLRHPALPDALSMHEKRPAALPWHPANDLHVYSLEWSGRELI